MESYDMHFELHSIEYLTNLRSPDGKAGISPEYLNWLKENSERCVLNPNSLPSDFLPCIEYPIAGVIERFGRYFTNTIAEMIAYALLTREVDEIALYGVNMEGDEEYGAQRACCEYMLGVCVGMGVKVVVPSKSPIMKCSHVYGLEEMPPQVAELKDSYKRAKQNVKEQEEKEKSALYNKGYAMGWEAHAKKMLDSWVR